MHKVVVERPRGGQGWARKFPRPKVPFDDLPKHQGIKRPHRHHKWFTDVLGPLRRWLRAQVGRLWDDVYSEACAVIKPDSVVRAHIKTHLLEFVLRDTFMHAGEVWCFARYRWFGTNELPVTKLAGRWTAFYVHPQTGLLCEIPAKPRSRWRDKTDDDLARVQRWLDDTTLLRQCNGIWFESRMESFPAREVRREGPLKFDLNTHRLLSRTDAERVYGRPTICVAKRQLSRRELKRHGLVNALAGAQPSTHSRWSAVRAARTVRRSDSQTQPSTSEAVWQTHGTPKMTNPCLKSPASVARASRPRRRLSAASASSTATRSCAKSSGATTSARAVRAAAFAGCCLRSGLFDGSRRNYFFPRMKAFRFGNRRARRISI